MRIKDLQVYPYIYEDMYRGISKLHFPKWEGWKLSGQAKEDAVDAFYSVYFYYAMKLDIIKDEALVNLILNFATLHGKKKAISKLQKVCEFPMTGVPSIELMEYVSENTKDIIYIYILEILEFYDFIHKPEDGVWAINTYRYL